MGQVGAPVHLVQSEEDVDALRIPRDTPVAYVTQTTLPSTTRATSSPR